LIEELELLGDAPDYGSEFWTAMIDHRAAKGGGDFWGNRRRAWDAEILFHVGSASHLYDLPRTTHLCASHCGAPLRRHSLKV
jgi:hypothetical protein